MDWRNQQIPIVTGIDTSHDDVTFPIGVLQSLENGIFSKNGAIYKRPGYDSLGIKGVSNKVTVPNAVSLASRGDQLLFISDEGIYNYLESNSTWSTASNQASISEFVPCTIQEYKDIVLSDLDTPVVSVAETDKLIGYTFDSVHTSAEGGWAVLDKSGNLLYKGSFGSNARSAKVYAVGESLIFLFYNVSTSVLYAQRINPADLVGTIGGSATAIKTSTRYFSASVDTVRERLIIGVIGPAGVYNTLYGIELDESLTVHQNSTVLTSGGGLFAYPSVCVNTNRAEVAFAVYEVSTTSAQVVVAGLGSDFTTFSYSDASVLATSLTEYPAAFTVALDEDAVYTVATKRNASTPTERDKLFTVYHKYVFSTATETDDQIFYYGCRLNAQAFVIDGRAYLSVTAFSGRLETHNSNIIYRIDGVMAAVYCNASADDSYPTDGTQYFKHLPSVSPYNGGVTIGASYRVSLPSAYEDQKAHRQPRRFFFSLAQPQTLDLRNITLISSGLPVYYDGISVVENGFIFYPEVEVDYTSTDIADHGGVTEAVGTYNLDGGVYGYKVYYEWTNAHGQKERSSAVPFSCNVTDGYRVTLTIPTLKHTFKYEESGTLRKPGQRASDVNIVVYRTTANGSVYYRVSSPNPNDSSFSTNKYLVNNPTVDEVTFIDEYTDAGSASNTYTANALTSREIDPLAGGIIDNSLWASPTLLARTFNRVFAAGGTVPESQVIYSKLHSVNEPVEFNEALTIDINSMGGEITALATLGNNLIVFKNNHIYLVSGEGPNNLGYGSFNKEYLVASDVGCANVNSVLLVPNGIFFQSDKGFHILRENYVVQNIGEQVQDYWDDTSYHCSLLADDDLIICVSETGTTLAYNYKLNVWSTYSGHKGTGSITIGDDYYYVNTNGEVYKRNKNKYLDKSIPYSLSLEVGQIRMAEYWRARKFSILGKFRDDHELEVKIAYDRAPYSETATFDVSDFATKTVWGGNDTWGSGSLWGGTSNDYIVEHRFGKQKVNMVKMKITEKRPSGNSLSLNELFIEWQPKSGLQRIGSTRKI